MSLKGKRIKIRLKTGEIIEGEIIEVEEEGPKGPYEGGYIAAIERKLKEKGIIK